MRGYVVLRGLLARRDRHAAAVRAIVELIDGSALAAEVEDALAHVETCPACRHEVADLAPIVLGLRRFGAAVRGEAIPSTNGWSRLARILVAGRQRPRTSLRAVAPALIAPLVVAVALMPTLGASRAAYETGPTLSETGSAVGSAGAQPLRPAERPVDERANYDVLRWASAVDGSGSGDLGSLVGLRIPGLPSPDIGERATDAASAPLPVATGEASVTALPPSLDRGSGR